MAGAGFEPTTWVPVTTTHIIYRLYFNMGQSKPLFVYFIHFTINNKNGINYMNRCEVLRIVTMATAPQLLNNRKPVFTYLNY